MNVDTVKTLAQDFVGKIDFSDEHFWWTVLFIAMQPTIWNIIARLEHKTHFLSTISGGKFNGVVVVSIIVLTGGRFRDASFVRVVENQPAFEQLNCELCAHIALGLIVFGATLVMTSFYKLGWKATFMGDYFGYLLEDRVTSFPFNMYENPMYVGSTMIFLGKSLGACSPAGFLLTAWVWVVYVAAIQFEGPYTAKIYSQRDQDRAAKAQ